MSKIPLLKFLLTMSLAVPLVAAGLSSPVLGHDDDDRDHDHDNDRHHGSKSPKVVLISLDGAKPDLIQKFIDEGVLPKHGGLATLSRGVVARQNVTATPSLTAVAPIASPPRPRPRPHDPPPHTLPPLRSPAGGRPRRVAPG